VWTLFISTFQVLKIACKVAQFFILLVLCECKNRYHIACSLCETKYCSLDCKMCIFPESFWILKSDLQWFIHCWVLTLELSKIKSILCMCMCSDRITFSYQLVFMLPLNVFKNHCVDHCDERPHSSHNTLPCIYVGREDKTQTRFLNRDNEPL